MEYINPSKLKPGDCIAVLSPSAGVAEAFPQIYRLGIQNLQEYFGLKVKQYSTTGASNQYLWRNPQKRAEDINSAFADNSVNAIISTIGGDDSVRILPYLDIDVIKANPKIIMGYSDTTTLLSYLNQNGLVTFYGPSVMAGISQLGALGEGYSTQLRNFLFAPKNEYSYRPYPRYSEGYPDWSNPLNIGKIKNTVENNEGWQVLQGEGKVSGTLWGGCTTVLQMMTGTKFWPNEHFWEDKIIFLETSEEKPLPKDIRYFLRNLGMQGVWQKASALIFGRPPKYSKEEKLELNEVLVNVIKSEFGRDNLPIWANLDFGHTDPQFILPMGVRAELDSDTKSFKLIESPFRPD